MPHLTAAQNIFIGREPRRVLDMYGPEVERRGGDRNRAGAEGSGRPVSRTGPESGVTSMAAKDVGSDGRCAMASGIAPQHVDCQLTVGYI